MHIVGRFLATSVLAVVFISPAFWERTAHSVSMLLISQAAGAQTLIPIARFSSVELRGGGKAVLRHGPIQRVTLLKGSTAFTGVTVSGDRLLIDKCREKCPGGYQLEIELVAPEIAGISIADGGTIEVRGSFPRREEISVAVSDGGAIDIRSLTVGSVTASVNQGGVIFTKPQSVLVASVRQGGNITYWGDARITLSVQHGGVVKKGALDDADKPFSDFGSLFQSTPPIPPVPPIPPAQDILR